MHSVIDVEKYIGMTDGIRIVGHGKTKVPFIGVKVGTSVDFVYTGTLIHLYDLQTRSEIACKRLPINESGKRADSIYANFMHIEDILEECPEYFIAQGKTKINIGEVSSGTNCTMAIVFDKSIIQLNDIDTGDLLAEVKIKLVLA